ncbi:aspartate/glutamate racemase family protein [Aminithiophilus ramosus]|uniref:Aspartate/glutamate racemase family protein n=3 Tax=Synergistia TaxID=649775 RepID=A0A9Q7EWJ0_9BACT|nr:aspartate/glutamate racemase family protein [Aminithiophilus ramosus]QVL36944.1 aspartate/glutamate racemase family protein [Synergistota bacterium]
MRTMGLIGGLSWESSRDYYRIVNEEVNSRLGGLHSAPCVLSSLDFDPLARAMAAGEWEICRRLVVDSACRLQRAGADFLLICSNTMHAFAGDVEARTGLPLLHIVDAIGRPAGERGFRTVGLLGTRALMEADHYRRRMEENWGLSVLVPDAEERETVNEVIFGELCRGRVLDASRQVFLKIMENLAARGAEAVVLGCTEIPMLVGAGDTELPLFDSLRLHALAAVDLSLAEEG